jgi:3-phenylpropionate/trans-cinnamate dioxygenase ferredoxin reductase subunit
LKYCKYLVVGGGLAADAAVRGIRDVDRAGSIGIVSDESDPPYERPALSRTLWMGGRTAEIWHLTNLMGAELWLNARIVAIDPANKIAIDANGRGYGYERLLLATGGAPRRLAEADTDPSVIYFRALVDFRRAWHLASLGAEFAVIGGGILGPEISASLAMNARKVSMIFPEECIGERLYPRPLANFLNVYFRKNGVNVHFGERVDRIHRQGEKLIVHTNRKDGKAVDVVIVSIGIEPNVELARSAGLDVRNGVVVDETLRTSFPDIYAAGDVAEFPCFDLGRQLRIEHADNACVMGRVAGHNMAGRPEPYRHLPSFYSHVFDLGYEAVGEIDSEMEIVEDWDQKFRKGVIYYLRETCVRGVLFWNTRGLLNEARDLISSRRRQSAGSLLSFRRKII